MRILMVLIPDCEISFRHLPLDQFVEPYYRFRDAGADIVIASPDGGTSFDRLARLKGVPAALIERFALDTTVREALADTLPIMSVYPEDFDAAYCLGDPHRLLHRDHDEAALPLLACFLAADKPIVTIPGPADIRPGVLGRGILIACASNGCAARATTALLAMLDVSGQLL